ncbi:MAG: GNAT family N-acetyltransferase [Proteobacteria bacterium]|nr:GNAT family N-acetyltransferase [Pseudomonadota bacterium]
MPTIRPTRREDTALILQLIRELAEYEKLSHAVAATEDVLRENLFGTRPQAEVVIAEQDGETAGFALFFHNFSTFMGKRGLYLEDLYVRPNFRGKGIGKVLLKHLAKIAVDRDCGRFEWAVLDWNKPARNFYVSLGAEPVPEWDIFRVTGDALERLAHD